MILIKIDRSSKTPVYRQICDRIIQLIEEGALRPGDRLPTTRGLAEFLGVHRSTVLLAYDEIRALGYLESTAGSYTTVRKRWRAPVIRQSSPIQSGFRVIDWEKSVSRLVHRARGHSGASDQSEKSRIPATMMDLDTLAPDPVLSPDDDLRNCIRSILIRNKAAALHYTNPLGWKPLRESLALRLRLHGMAVSPQDILITNGAQQAFDLILRLLIKPGEPVLVEAPTYGMAHTLLRLHGARTVEIPMTPDGMDLNILEKTLGMIRPKILYTIPTFHNPTGITTNQAHRERLLNICEKARVVIVEDGFEEEMKYFGKAVLPIKSMDTAGIVFYIGTFSKTVFSGLRIGWIAAPRETIGFLTSIQQASCISVNTLAQAAFERFCNGGQFDRYLRRVHKIYRRRMQTMLRGLNEYMPAGITWTRPAGGYTLWLSPPESAGKESVLCDEFWKAGLAVGPGRRYFARKRRSTHFRLSISRVDEETIEEACRRMGQILADRIGME
jgi:DNA-binding transcriptional MocR family regulator